MTEEEYLDMESLTVRSTGIPNVVLWVGPSPESYQRVYVVNSPNSYKREEDYFTLSIPDYRIMGRVNTDFITPEVIEKIKNWCNQNMKAILDYSNYKTSTCEFIDQLKPIKD